MDNLLPLQRQQLILQLLHQLLQQQLLQNQLESKALLKQER